MGVPSFTSVRNWGFPQTMFSNKISSNKNIPYSFREQEIQIKAFWELGMTLLTSRMNKLTRQYLEYMLILSNISAIYFKHLSRLFEMHDFQPTTSLGFIKITVLHVVLHRFTRIKISTGWRFVMWRQRMQASILVPYRMPLEVPRPPQSLTSMVIHVHLRKFYQCTN